MFNTDIAIRKSVEEYILHRDLAIEEYKSVCQCVERLKTHCDQIGPNVFPSYKISSLPSLERFTKEVDRRSWKEVFEKTGLDKVMDLQARAEFKETLDSEDVPVLSLETLQSTYLSLAQNAEEIFERGVVNAFKYRCEGYKTNQKEAFTIGKKLIIEWAFERDISGNGDTVRIRRGSIAPKSELINDIDRIVCQILDKPFHTSDLSHRIETTFRETGKNVYQDENYLIRGYKKGTMHWTFSNPQIVEGINRVIARAYEKNTLA